VGQDAETVSSRVVIEPGSSPLYVVLSSFVPTIWRFEGAISRVRRAVLVGMTPHGVTGIASDRVVLRTLPGAVCFENFDDTHSAAGVAAREFVEGALGRTVDVFAAAYAIGTLSLPSGSTAATATPAAPPGFDPNIYSRGIRFTPGGVVDIDPAAVVPTGLAQAYDVLPAEMGLAQLVASGALVATSEGGFPDHYLIAEPIPRFPAGLYGSEAVWFVLGGGVPLPAGNPGHSCVVSEETGLPIVNAQFCDASSSA
jgi:hypothetical protein